ncbi:CCA tRNA nucleotidyltransferase [Candidatus Peregrinibacteria bacterium]|nr:CCA tRNA nucleotidyltransferase [Candidatus Peregrinibacteria bacterium]
MMPTSIEIIKILRKAGHEAYWAGGCVRDILLGIKPKDYDIVTSAKPDEIEDLLEKTIPIGKEFGVILAIQEGHHFEVATFRSDSGYSDGRRPDAIIFTSAKEDAKRRDFTINGMFYDPIEDKIHDYVGGQKDLEARLIRFIGDPHERILEDHLRILRAIRFKNQFNFQYEPKTYTALHKHARLVVDKVAKERISAELDKMLLSEHPTEALEDMEDLGVLEVLLPEIQAMKGLAQPYKYHTEGDVWDHALLSLKSLPSGASLAVRMATLLHDVGKTVTFSVAERIRFDHHAQKSGELAKEILTRLHYPRKFIDEIVWLVTHHMMLVELLKMPEGKKRKWFLHPWFLNLMQVCEADAAGTVPGDDSLVQKVLKEYRRCMKEMPRPPKPLLSGEDVMKMLQIKPGKKVGDILNEMHELQLEMKLKTKLQATDWLKENFLNKKSAGDKKIKFTKRITKKSRQKK